MAPLTRMRPSGGSISIVSLQAGREKRVSLVRQSGRYAPCLVQQARACGLVHRVRPIDTLLRRSWRSPPSGAFPGVTRVSVFVSGAFWCKPVYSDLMSIAEKLVRQSVSLPARVARQVKSMAKTGNTSANRIIVNLIESGIEVREQQRKRFFELADRLAHTRDAEDQKRLKEELARMTFGE